MQFRDLKRQYEALRPQIDEALAAVFQSQAYILGPPVQALEAELAAYVGVAHCVSCGNGTEALSLALAVWEIGPGAAVFVPDFTFFASAEVVAACGATPVFVDVDARTFNLNPVDLEQKIQAVQAEGRLRPAVVLAVDLFGLPAPYPEIQSLARKHKLLILEDGAQGFGGRIGAQRACSFGDMATTSFFPAKPLGAYGDGGALFTSRAEWAARAASLRSHGQGTDRYDHVRIGMNSRLDSLQAALLRVKLRAFQDYEWEAVNRAAAAYTQALEGSPLLTPYVPEGYASSWAQYTVILPRAARRAEVQRELRARGVPSMVYYPRPLHAQPAFHSPAQEAEPCPVASDLCQRVLSLPLHPYLFPEEGARVVAALQAALQTALQTALQGAL